MALFGVFGCFVFLVLAELAGNEQTRPITRIGFVVTLMAAGGVGPAFWVHGTLEILKSVSQIIL